MKSWIPMLVMCAACQTGPRATTTAANAPANATAPTTAANARTTAVAELAARRAQMIEWLRQYYEVGQYPTDDAGRVISVFRDTKGVRCPMAELIYRSGHADLVDAVVAENNEVVLADVKSGPLHDWMLASGLTGDEIAMVQGIPRDLEYSFEIVPEAEPSQSILAKARVRGRLETAVTALRNGTASGLETASKRLPDAKLPVIAAVGSGKVLPKEALIARPKVSIAPAHEQINFVRVGRTSFQIRN